MLSEDSQDIPTIFCGNEGNNYYKDFLPPTTCMHWRIAPNKIIHYDGCCSIYEELIKKEKEVRIKIKLYEYKIYEWKCPHTEQYYKNKFNYDNERKEPDAPPPLILKYTTPECCIYDPPISHVRRKSVSFSIDDALNDPDVIKEYNDYIQLNNTIKNYPLFNKP